MTNPTRSLTALLLIGTTAFSSGCVYRRNISRSPEVIQSGLIGREFQTTQALVLVRDRRSRILSLVTEDFPLYGNYKRLGEVEAGTALRVDKIVRQTDLAGFMILPYFHTRNYTLARIESGSHEGKQISVDGDPVYREESAAIRNNYLVQARPIETRKTKE